jgi:AcrR family transcriptional regulator
LLSAGQLIRTKRIVSQIETYRSDLGVNASTMLFVDTTDRSTGDGSRSERARSAILSAAAQLLDEVGFASMTIEEVAARAKAGKATIYRRWPNKGTLAMDALMAEIGGAAPFPDTGSAVEDFRLQLRAVARVFTRPRIRHMLLGVIFEGQGDPELREAFRDRYMNPRRDQARAVVTRGISRGELRPGFDEEVLFDQLYGALYFRLLVSGRPLNRRFTDELVDQAFGGLLGDSASSARKPSKRRETTSDG